MKKQDSFIDLKRCKRTLNNRRLMSAGYLMFLMNRFTMRWWDENRQLVYDMMYKPCVWWDKIIEKGECDEEA